MIANVSSLGSWLGVGASLVVILSSIGFAARWIRTQVTTLATESIATQLSEIKTDLGDLRTELQGSQSRMDADMRSLRSALDQHIGRTLAKEAEFHRGIDSTQEAIRHLMEARR